MRPHTRTHCTKKGDCEGEVRCPRAPHARGREGGVREEGCRHLYLVELPAELLVKIIEYIPFKDHSKIRLVCRRLNEIAAGRLNSTFTKLQNKMLIRFQNIKAQMPRRESARRQHPLARECDIVETLHMRLTLLQMTFGKHIERKHICFFPGEILDEVFRILYYIQSTSLPLGRAYKVTDELFDLSTMAMEYFKENIEPNLPELTYFGADFLDFTPPFASPLKKVARPGLDSPISSRASVIGSSCSEPPLSYSQFDAGEEGLLDGGEEGEAPQSNMVLRKRIKRIRAGMKKYNTQLDEVKRELKSCKSKMDGQSKQVAEYSSRLDEYDKKFDENSRKFGTLLTELNKCKTELQFYRSRSHLQQCQNCGSSFTDQASDSAITDQVSYPSIDLEGVDKQAMVEDWLNPEGDADSQTQEGYVGHSPGYREPVHSKHCSANRAVSDESVAVEAPGVQFNVNETFIQKFSKTDDDGYLRSGPGSPGYTRGGPRSPGSPRSPGPPGSPGPSGVKKRKSRDDEERKLCLRGHHMAKGSRPKRPKQVVPS